MDQDTARRRVLDAAEELFYARGVQAVGMDEIRSASGVSLKRLYRLFPAKEALVEAYLLRRDARWRAALARYVDARPAPEGASGDGGLRGGSGRGASGGPGPDRPGPAAARHERILAVFDWLHTWFAEPGFRGCAFVNSFGELGATSRAVADAARAHKTAFRDYLAGLVAAAGEPDALADHLLLLADGAITAAALSGSPDPALRAREAAGLLLRAGGTDAAAQDARTPAGTA